MNKYFSAAITILFVFGFASYAHAGFFDGVFSWFQKNLGGSHIATKKTTYHEIADLQQALKTQGAFAGRTTGTFDTRTRKSIKDFQVTHDLTPTGRIDIPTEETLTKEYLSQQEQRITDNEHNSGRGNNKINKQVTNTTKLLDRVKMKLRSLVSVNDTFIPEEHATVVTKEEKPSSRGNNTSRDTNARAPSLSFSLQQLYEKQDGVLPPVQNVLEEDDNSLQQARRIVHYNDSICIFEKRPPTHDPWYDTHITKQNLMKRHPGLTNGFYQIFWFGSGTWSKRKFQWNTNDKDWKSDKHVIRYFFDHWHRFVRCPEGLSRESFAPITTSTGTSSAAVSAAKPSNN